MTDSETDAQKLIRKKYGKEAYIKKIPDFKQTGSMNGGLPDYMVLNNGDYTWYEIKYLNIKKKSFSVSEFTDQQLVEFNKMTKAGANIIILAFFGKEVKQANVEDIFDYYRNHAGKAVPKDEEGVWYSW